MGRYRYPADAPARQPRYLVLWSMDWAVIECQRLEPSADFVGAMAAAIARLERAGWYAEGDTAYGFTFVRSSAERRLLMITGRDPRSTALQSFNPFRGT